ncbi:MAG: hypothetical protein IPK79_10865 [Vampirovibrionales bacterium]|nr:hypothetical protein [Vampirovibrionales bacterium]
MHKLLIFNAICIAIRLVLIPFHFDSSALDPPWHGIYLAVFGFSILLAPVISVLFAWKSRGASQKFALIQMALLMLEPYLLLVRTLLSFKHYNIIRMANPPPPAARVSLQKGNPRADETQREGFCEKPRDFYINIIFDKALWI